jgi:Domain of unknown function (DUF4307)
VTPAAPMPTFPPGRYGRRRDPARQRRRRFITFALATLIAAAGVLIAVKLYRQYTVAPYQVTIIGVSDPTDHAVTVTFDVTTPPGGGASCTILAHTREGEEVGRALVSVPAGARGQTVTRVTYTLATTKRPVTGEVPGCGP